MLITIVGFGNIGKCITNLLIQHSEASLTINVLDIDDSINGALLDFEHALELRPKVKIIYNSKDHFNQSDFIFHCAGANVPPGKSRLDICEESIAITKQVFKDHSPTKIPFIIVVANPVELICYYTRAITKLPNHKVVGTGTLLDSLRMNYILKKEYSQFEEVEIVMLGEHGNSVFISEELSRVNSNTVSSFFNKSELADLVDKVKSSAAEIKATQQATIYGVSQCAFEIFKALLQSNIVKMPVSTCLSNEEIKIWDVDFACLSMYSSINSSGVYPVKNYKPNEKEKALLKESSMALKACLPLKNT